MEDQRFDHLSRRLAGMRTRRQALTAIAGAMAGIVTGSRAANARSCTAQYGSCQADDQCCAGAVCEYGLCMPGCRVDGGFVTAWMSPPDNICAQCRPEISTDSWSPANEGMSCWSGDPTAGATFCQSGACRPTESATCPPPPPCHTEQLIDPATCTYAVAEAGTYCGGQAMCHGGFYQPADTCDGHGFCIGGGSQTVSCAPYQCGDGRCLAGCATDGECASGSGCCAGRCVALGTVEHCGGCGDACTAPDACTPASCVNGACTAISACIAPDTCTPASCANGICSTVSACGEDTVCENGACVDTCPEIGTSCSSAEECCGEGQTCGQLTSPSSDHCCLELGAEGCTEFWGECCGATEGFNVYCEAGVCGGDGAQCFSGFASTCASGNCCGTSLIGTCCSVNETCDGDTCVPCPEIGTPCLSAEECCGEGQTCGQLSSPSSDQCCLELGAEGCGEVWGDCCGATEGFNVYCGNGFCGGAGAQCFSGFASTCASGNCCGTSLFGTCCASDETCVDDACVPA